MELPESSTEEEARSAATWLRGAIRSASCASLMLYVAQITAFSLSLGLIQRAGVPVDTFMAILRESAFYTSAFDKKLPRLLKRDYANPNFSSRHLLKDVELMLSEASRLGLDRAVLTGCGCC